MAHTALHFSLGLVTAAGASLPALLRLRRRRSIRISTILGLWLAASYCAAIFAVVPNILRGLGTPEPVCSGWWMNIFLFHPVINAVKSGGMLVGELLLGACFATQYLVILLALRSVRNRPGQPSRRTPCI